MPRDLIQGYMNDPVVLAAAGAVLVLLLGLVLSLVVRSRSRKRAREEQSRAELAVIERETQFTSAAEQLRHCADSGEASFEISNLLNNYMAMPVLAIYAGRHHDGRLTNILQAQPGGFATGSLAALPPTMPAIVLSEYPQPLITPLSTFSGLRAGELTLAASGPTGANIVRRVAVLPWRGHFGWSGLIVARAHSEIGVDALMRFSEALGYMGSRLSVALELESKRSEINIADRQLSRVAGFARSLIKNLDQPSPMGAIAQGVADLLASDSAALWRVDTRAKMVTMMAQYGLRSAEFLPVPLGQGFVGRLAESGEPLSIVDAPADPRCLFPSEARDSGIGSYLGVPVIAGGETVGVLEVHTTGPRAWTERDARMLQSAAEVIAEVVDRKPAPRSPLRVESAYLALSEALQRLRTHDEVMEAAVEVLGHAMGVSRALIIEFEAPSGEAVGQPKPVRFEYNEPELTSAAGVEFAPGFAGRVLSESSAGSPVARNSSKEGSLADAEMVERLQALSELAVPIKLGEGLHAIVYLNQCDRVREWQAEEVEFAHRVGSQLSLSLANVLALEAASRGAELAREEVKRLADVNTRALGLIDSLPEPVVGLDQQGRVSFFNAAARARLGLKNEDLGHMAELTEALAMADEAMWDRVAACNRLTHLVSQAISPSVLNSAQRQSGPPNQSPSPLPVSIAVAPVRDEKGEITGRVLLLSDISHVGAAASREVSASIAELEQRLGELERALMEARAEESRARVLAERARLAEADSRAAAEAAQRAEAELRKERDQVRQDEARTRRSAQQLMDVNRLKSEFIVKAGRDLETSLQSLLSSADMLEQGSYGKLTEDQLEALHGICSWARRMKSDVAWMVEYSATRPPHGDPGEVPQDVEQQSTGESA